MEKALLALVRESIGTGYLHPEWHRWKADVVKTGSGFLALLTDCMCVEGAWYHEIEDEECFILDEEHNVYILSEHSISVWRGPDDTFRTSVNYRHDYHEYSGRYYTDDGLEAHDLVVTADGDVAHRNDVYYWDSDDEYHYEDEYNDDDSEVWGYHDGPCPPDYRDDAGCAGIGFEIEKGASPVFCGYRDKEALFDGTGCVIEEDSSVDWELKTPIYPLFSGEVENKWLPQIRAAINAEDHTDAGGHIHLSLPPKSGARMFDHCRPYLPLFMAMYTPRLKNDYCKGKTEKLLKVDVDKHQAIKIWGDRIELRFPAKVYDMESLIFRLAFCRLMVEKEYRSILSVTRAAFDGTTRLGKLVASEYKGRESILLQRVLDVAKCYFDTNIANEKPIEKLMKAFHIQTSLKTSKTKQPCVLQF